MAFAVGLAVAEAEFEPGMAFAVETGLVDFGFVAVAEVET